MRRTHAALALAVVLVASGCASYAGPAPTASTMPGSATGGRTPIVTPSVSPPPAPATPTPLPVLPDGRTGAALNTPFMVRGVALINRNHTVSAAYAPKVATDFQLVPEADKAFAVMLDDAQKAGVSVVWRIAYRSYALQDAMSKSPSTAYGSEGASYVAKPGQSEHQAGLAVDVTSKSGSGTNFDRTKEFTWLRANAHKYGFILRYPEGKTAITGFNYEPWHYRYVGPTVAAAFGPNSTLTLEEYLGGS